jgi:hypothetical protein
MISWKHIVAVKLASSNLGKKSEKWTHVETLNCSLKMLVLLELKPVTTL